MAPVVIPHSLVNKGDLVLIPKSEYEEFLALKKLVPETIVFDAVRDNKGKGLKAKQLLRILQKIS